MEKYKKKSQTRDQINTGQIQDRKDSTKTIEIQTQNDTNKMDSEKKDRMTKHV